MSINNYHEHVVPYNLSSLGITSPLILRNLAVPILYEEAIRYEKGSILSDTGSLAVTSHKYTGRLPKEKRIVKDKNTKNTIAWGDINIPIDDHAYLISRSRALDYLNSRNRIYVVDSFAGWDKNHRIKVRTICSRAYHAIFMTNMLIVPTTKELESYGNPDYTIINAGVFPANKHSLGITSDASVIIHFTRKEMTILGTEYAGEMKKGLFCIINYLMPFKKILPMHCAANVDSKENTTLLFGLSGTGKTTLSSDQSRHLVGDDEHCWSDDGIFNIEGGCYAKCTKPPSNIKKCITFGALLENLTYDLNTREMNYSDESITSNTRSAYPLSHVKNVKTPAVSSHPNNIIFLTCDVFGVLPPIAKLNEKQALYHFISGYTSKTPNTEVGITEPTATFSACFGEVFFPLTPIQYAMLFRQKIKQHKATVWLINTGWVDGNFHTGSRISLKTTKNIVAAIHDNRMTQATFRKDPVFGFDICIQCKRISEILDPREAWRDKQAYDKQALMLATMFNKNIERFDNNSIIIEGGPILRKNKKKSS